jgi:peptide/nickel transport system permease protein
MYNLKKLLRALLSIMLVLTLTFIVLRSAGDPASIQLPADAPPEALEAYRTLWGLNKPLSEQYIGYLMNVLTGDFGRSLLDGQDALSLVFERLPATLILVAGAMGITVLIGIPAGIIAAINREKFIDRFIMGFSVVGFSLPHFFLAMVVILIFAVELRLLPSAGSDTLAHMVLPTIAMSLSRACAITRLMRSSLLEVLNKPFIRAAKARGLSQYQVMLKHGLPNAMLPTLTMLGFTISGFISGAVVIETVFAWPGIGRLLMSSVQSRDLAVVQTVVIFIASVTITINLMIDFLYGWIDPRIKNSKPVS